MELVSNKKLLNFLRAKDEVAYSHFMSVLDHIQPIFPYQGEKNETDAGQNHLSRVQDILCELIPDSVAENLHAYEICILLLSTYMHDIGRAFEQNSGIHHSQLSARYVSALRAIKDEFLSKAVEFVVAAHGKFPIEKMPAPYLVMRSPVRLKFIAALIKLADELETNYERAPSQVSDNKIIDPGSVGKWEFRRQIQGIYISSDTWSIQPVIVPIDRDGFQKSMLAVTDLAKTFHMLRKHLVAYPDISLPYCFLESVVHDFKISTTDVIDKLAIVEENKAVLSVVGTPLRPFGLYLCNSKEDTDQDSIFELVKTKANKNNYDLLNVYDYNSSDTPDGIFYNLVDSAKFIVVSPSLCDDSVAFGVGLAFGLGKKVYFLKTKNHFNSTCSALNFVANASIDMEQFDVL